MSEIQTAEIGTEGSLKFRQFGFQTFGNYYNGMPKTERLIIEQRRNLNVFVLKQI